MHDGGFLSCPEKKKTFAFRTVEESVFYQWTWYPLYVLLSYFFFGAKDVHISIIIGRMAYKQ